MSIDQLEGLQEDNVLTVLAWDAQHAPMLALQLTPELFSTRAYQKVAEAALTYIHKYHAPPRVHLRDLLEDDLRRGEDGRFLNTILTAMDQLQADMQSQFIMDNLDRFIAIRKLTIKATEALDRLHAGDLEAAQEAISGVDVTNSDLQAGVYIQDTKSWFSFYNKDEDEETFSSGISILDDRGVHPKRKALFLVMASAGRGKSTWLRQIGCEAVIARKNVLHITLENDLEETLEAYTQTFLGRSQTGVEYQVPVFLRNEHTRAMTTVEMQSVQPKTMASRAEVVAEFSKVQRRAGRLLVQWFPSRSLTVAQLNAYIDMVEHKDNFKPDLLILDYADEMYIDMTNLRMATGALYRDLRGLGGRRNMAVATASQTNRLSENARVVGGGMVAEDWSKIGTADMVCTYSQTSAEREISLARILVYKARRAKDKWFALITQSYATGQFCLDSCYFNSYVEKEITGYIKRRDDPDNERERAEAEAED